MPEGSAALRSRVPGKIPQHKLALLRIPAGLVTLDAELRTHLGPDLVHEEIVRHPAGWAGVRRLCSLRPLHAGERGEQQQGNGKQERTMHSGGSVHWEADEVPEAQLLELT